MKLSLRVRHFWASFVSGRKWACRNKIKWRSWERALEAYEGIKKKDEKRGGTWLNNPLEPYPCFWCWKWHLGRKSKHMHRLKYRLIEPVVWLVSKFE